MNKELGEQSNAHQQVIEYLIQVHARVARDVVQIAPSTWAIHGPIAVDGESSWPSSTAEKARTPRSTNSGQPSTEPPPLDGRRDLVPYAREEALTSNTGDT